MKTFKVNEKIFNLYPNLNIGVIISRNIDNNYEDKKYYEEELNKVIEKTHEKIKDLEFAKIKVVSDWREAYKKFKNPQKNRSSIESLLKRVHKGNTLNPINPLVDLYNIISIKHFIPVGAENLDKIDGEMELTFSNGSEDFILLGSNEITRPYDGEVIYKNGNDVICRCFNFRESDKTKITEETKNAIVVLEFLDENCENINIILDELKSLIEEKLKGQCKSIIVNKDKRDFVIES